MLVVGFYEELNLVPAFKILLIQFHILLWGSRNDLWHHPDIEIFERQFWPWLDFQPHTPAGHSGVAESFTALHHITPLWKCLSVRVPVRHYFGALCRTRGPVLHDWLSRQGRNGCIRHQLGEIPGGRPTSVGRNSFLLLTLGGGQFFSNCFRDYFSKHFSKKFFEFFLNFFWTLFEFFWFFLIFFWKIFWKFFWKF